MVEGSKGNNYTIRFHLHPSVQVQQSHGLRTILLKLFRGIGWKFQASEGTICVKESVYLNGKNEPKRSNQIVISGRLVGGSTKINWRFYKC